MKGLWWEDGRVSVVCWGTAVPQRGELKEVGRKVESWHLGVSWGWFEVGEQAG
jgi:hypothetical protein